MIVTARAVREARLDRAVCEPLLHVSDIKINIEKSYAPTSSQPVGARERRRLKIRNAQRLLDRSSIARSGDPGRRERSRPSWAITRRRRSHDECVDQDDSPGDSERARSLTSASSTPSGLVDQARREAAAAIPIVTLTTAPTPAAHRHDAPQQHSRRTAVPAPEPITQRCWLRASAEHGRPIDRRVAT